MRPQSLKFHAGLNLVCELNPFRMMVGLVFNVCLCFLQVVGKNYFQRLLAVSFQNDHPYDSCGWERNLYRGMRFIRLAVW